VKKITFSSWPSHSKEEIEAVSQVLSSNKTNYWNGDQVKQFEREFADFSNTKHAVALSNGTVALEVALNAIDIQIGDEVIVASRTYLASASSIVNVGGIPIFCDVDRDTQVITAKNILSKLSKKTKAIICVHLAGWPCDMDPIIEIAKNNNILVIEDCAQAHGAKYKGKSVGSFGSIGCWSFCQDKIISTGGEGGMVTTNDRNLWSRMWSLKDHGKDWMAVNSNSSKVFKLVHHSFGSNFRMTEMQAAIGRIQLKNMPKWNKSRRKNAEKIWEFAKNIKHIRVPYLTCDLCSKLEMDEVMCKHNIHAAYKCYIFVEGTKEQRDRIVSSINEKGVPCFSGSCSEVYLEKSFQDANLAPTERLPIAKELGDTSLMFLCHPTITDIELENTLLALEISVKECFHD
tara:strand:- start:1186 stop:2391 length:1206 start_codon:yes stop_codon:yes gene_type:complete